VAHYHSKTPVLGAKYKRRVVEVMRAKGLLADPPKAPAGPVVTGGDEVEDKG
jgi:hypothetical protein